MNFKFTNSIIVAIILSLPVCAQHISIGPAVGAGISMVSNNQEGVDVNPQFMWNAGGTFVYSTKTHLGFGADLKYSAEGYNKITTPLIITDADIHLNYLRIPVRLLYFFGEYGDHFRPKVFLGLTPGILLSAKADDGITETDIKDSINSFDLGLHGGVGINFRLKEGIWLNTDISYYHGFLDIQSAEANNSLLNSNLVVDVGVAFGIGSK
ncbi:MAG: PorT family protein [Chitinophagales bacterium]|nr:PorT family protein [Chitinophagales bacterium]